MTNGNITTTTSSTYAKPATSSVVHVSSSNNNTITGSKYFTTTGWINSTTNKPSQIVTEDNLIELFIKAIDNMSENQAAKLRVHFEFKYMNKKTRNEYETLLKLSNNNYEKVLNEIVTNERNKIFKQYIKNR